MFTVFESNGAARKADVKTVAEFVKEASIQRVHVNGGNLCVECDNGVCALSILPDRATAFRVVRESEVLHGVPLLVSGFMAGETSATNPPAEEGELLRYSYATGLPVTDLSDLPNVPLSALKPAVRRVQHANPVPSVFDRPSAIPVVSAPLQSQEEMYKEMTTAVNDSVD